MPSHYTHGPDYLDKDKKKKKKPSTHDLVKTGRPTPKKGTGLLKKGVTGTTPYESRFDPEVLKKYPYRPKTETYGVSVMRQKMQDRINKKKKKKK